MVPPVAQHDIDSHMLFLCWHMHICTYVCSNLCFKCAVVAHSSCLFYCYCIYTSYLLENYRLNKNFPFACLNDLLLHIFTYIFYIKYNPNIVLYMHKSLFVYIYIYVFMCASSPLLRTVLVTHLVFIFFFFRSGNITVVHKYFITCMCIYVNM